MVKPLNAYISAKPYRRFLIPAATRMQRSYMSLLFATGKIMLKMANPSRAKKPVRQAYLRKMFSLRYKAPQSEMIRAAARAAPWTKFIRRIFLTE